jgi:hypothetical protein
MGTTLASIFNITISLATVSASTKGFGRGLILGSSNKFGGGTLWQIYTSAAAMLVSGGGVFANTDPEYLAAVAYFSQNPAPLDVMVGYATADVAQVETITPTAVDLATYAVTINGVVSSFTAGAGTTAALIVTGLKAAIAAQSPGLPVVTSGSTTLILTAAAAGEAFTCSVGANLVKVDTTPDAGPDTALSAIVAAGGTNWYCLVLTSRVDQDILDAAAWIEANGNSGLYIFIACNSEAAVLTNVSTDIASLLQAKAYVRTMYLWSDGQAGYPDAALAAIMLAATPGSATAAWKTLAGITPTALSVLTGTAVAQLTAKNANYYCTIAGANVTQPGSQVGGQWLDVVIGRDWLVANAQTAVFNTLIQLPKVPYTDPGIGLFANAVRGVLKQAVQMGILATGTASNGLQFPQGYTVTPPLASSISGSQKQTRILPPIPFAGLLAGAVNGGAFTGVLTN